MGPTGLRIGVKTEAKEYGVKTEAKEYNTKPVLKSGFGIKLQDHVTVFTLIASICFVSSKVLSIVKKLGLKPRRTLRLVLWTAEVSVRLMLELLMHNRYRCM